jgi:hypothetical protein
MIEGAYAPMKLTPWYLAALSPFAVLGVSGALTGQLAILLVVFGIFFGTLSLGRFTGAHAKTDPAKGAGTQSARA